MLASKYDYGQISIVQNIADKVTEPCWGIKNCQFVAAICRKLLATANSLPQFAGSFWQLPIRCRNLQEAFDTCQNVAAICRKLLTASDAVSAISDAWDTPSECWSDVLSNPRTFATEPTIFAFFVQNGTKKQEKKEYFGARFMKKQNGWFSDFNICGRNQGTVL